MVIEIEERLHFVLILVVGDIVHEQFAPSQESDINHHIASQLVKTDSHFVHRTTIVRINNLQEPAVFVNHTGGIIYFK